MADKQEARDTKSRQCTIQTVYSPLLVFMRISGMYSPFIFHRPRRRKKSLKEWLSCVISLLHFLFLAFVTIFSISKAVETTEMSASLMARLSHATLATGALYSFVTIWIFGSKCLGGFLEDFHKYHQLFGSHKYLPKFAKMVKRVTVTLYASCFIFPLLTGVYIFLYKDVMVIATDMTLPVYMKDSFNTMGSLVYIMSSTVVFCIVILVVTGLLTVTSVFLALEFKSITKSFKNALQISSSSTATVTDTLESSDLETLHLGIPNPPISRPIQKGYAFEKASIHDVIEHHRHQHDALCRLLGKANHFLSHIMFVVYATAIPMLCFVLYGMIAGSLPLKDFTNMLIEFCLEVFALLLVTALGIFLHQSIHGPLCHLYGISYKDLSVNTLNVVALFVNRLLSQTLGYSVYGLFVIQPSTVLMIGGTLTTYAVVVLQLSPVFHLIPSDNTTVPA